jgi:hypothetical protein
MQAPFVTLFLYLGAVPEGPEKEDLGMVIERMKKVSMLHQHFQSLYLFWMKITYMMIVNIIIYSN